MSDDELFKGIFYKWGNQESFQRAVQNIIDLPNRPLELSDGRRLDFSGVKELYKNKFQRDG